MVNDPPNTATLRRLADIFDAASLSRRCVNCLVEIGADHLDAAAAALRACADAQTRPEAPAAPAAPFEIDPNAPSLELTVYPTAFPALSDASLRAMATPYVARLVQRTHESGCQQEHGGTCRCDKSEQDELLADDVRGTTGVLVAFARAVLAREGR
jgi:hypothetical protein